MRKDDFKKPRTDEGLADLAQRAEHDHEVQMARADLYKIAKYAIKLHDMLKNISEAEGLEGWQQAKITKASDYISSVYHNLDYDMKFGDGQDMAEGKSPHKKGTKKYKKHMAAMHAESLKDRLASKLDEKITAKTDMGDVVKDFYKSDAPQFKGKSKEKRREMAVAAKLGAEDKAKK